MIVKLDVTVLGTSPDGSIPVRWEASPKKAPSVKYNAQLKTPYGHESVMLDPDAMNRPPPAVKDETVAP